MGLDLIVGRYRKCNAFLEWTLYTTHKSFTCPRATENRSPCRGTRQYNVLMKEHFKRLKHTNIKPPLIKLV